MDRINSNNNKVLPARAASLSIITACLVLLAALFVRPAHACRDCHRDTGKRESVHAPVRQGCAACHENLITSDCVNEHIMSTKHGLSSAPPGLCYKCHDVKVFGNDKAHGELPNNCIACHDPHASDTPKLLTSSIPGLCYRCHGRRPFEGQVVHKPILDGNCLSCHKFHAQAGESLLTIKEPDLCFTCHNSRKFQDNSRHAPVAAERCSLCHNPHSSGKPSMLAASLNYTCMKCHNALGNLGSQHDNIGFPIKKLSCVSCHNPHNQDWALMMKLNNSRIGLMRRDHSCNFCKVH
ncbi:MAG: hypothetical protein HY880_01760 [Deltaproteobacteria bacterium]|nr:hypothetical protein [Deltaproteobacteria bacterium]